MKTVVLCRDCGWMRDTDQDGYTLGLLTFQIRYHEAEFDHHTRVFTEQSAEKK